jgi:protease-4
LGYFAASFRASLASAKLAIALAAMLAPLALATGCQEPLQMAANVRLVPEFPQPGNAGPVKSMTMPEQSHDTESPAVAVIDVDGILLNSDFSGFWSAGENPVSLFRERLDAAACDPCVRAVVVRINSHGGGVTATDIMWHDLSAFRERTGLPVVACLMDVGAGGAYYVATAADQIVAHPTSVTGGIGVILNIYNLQDALQQFNVAAIPVRAGDKVDLGSPVKALDDDQRKLLQSMANNFHKRFRDVVHDGRPEVNMDDKTNFDGRVFTAEEAVKRRLVDQVGYLDDAISIARNMAHVPHARVVLFHRANDQAHSAYAITPNIPAGVGIVPVSLPGFDRTKLPGFLYMWQPEPTMEKLAGK